MPKKERLKTAQVNKNDVYDFVDYLISNSNGISFQMLFYNKNQDREEIFNSWNNNNRIFLS